MIGCALVPAAGVIGFVLGHGSEKVVRTAAAQPATSAPAPRVLETTGPRLKALSTATGLPVYWAGNIPGRKLELTQLASGGIMLRYLMPGAKLGIQQAKYLLVGTYPMSDAFQAIQRASHYKGAVVASLPHGGIVVTNRGRPTNAFFAFPNSPVQVEVFDPRPFQAQQWVLKGHLAPIS